MLLRSLALSLQHRQKGDAIYARCYRDMRHFFKTWKQVPKRTGIVTGAAGGNGVLPYSDKRLADTPFIQIAFDAPQGAGTVKESRIVATFLMRAVIARKYNKRIFGKPPLFNRFHDSAHIMIEPGNHRSIRSTGISFK